MRNAERSLSAGDQELRQSRHAWPCQQRSRLCRVSAAHRSVESRTNPGQSVCRVVSNSHTIPTAGDQFPDALRRSRFALAIRQTWLAAPGLSTIERLIPVAILPSEFYDVAIDLLTTIEEDLERALRDHEQRGDHARALAAYERALVALDRLLRSASVQRLRAYALMRAANVLNELDRLDEALACSERALVAAQRSEDEITLGRAQLAQAAVQLTRRETEQGLLMLHAAAETFTRGDSRDHREGLGWVHIIQADLRLLGLVRSEPAEIVARAEQALALLRPLANWSGVDRAHTARAAAWATYGWRETWQRFEREAILRGSPSTGLAWQAEARTVCFAIRVPAESVSESLKPLRAALIPFEDCISLHPDYSLHIAVHTVGIVSTRADSRDEITPAELEDVVTRARALVQNLGPLKLVFANVNAVPEAIFVEVHDPSGRLLALRDRLNSLRPTAAPAVEMIPHLAIASPAIDAPAPRGLIEALRGYRRWPIEEWLVQEVELVTLDPARPFAPLQRIATLPL